MKREHACEIADRVFRVEVPMPALNNMFSVYIIQGPESAIIEPGPARTIPIVQDAVRELGIDEIRWIIPTHLHIDHAGGTGSLAGLYPRARVVLHPRGVKHAVDPARLIEGTRMAWGDDFEESFGPILPVPESQIMAGRDGEVISTGDRELQIVHAPGHAPHQIVVFDRRVRGIFCGDAAGTIARHASEFPLPNTAPPGFDMQVYLETMEQLRNLRADVLFFSHGGVSREPDTMILKACEITRVFGEVVLKELKKGRSSDDINATIRHHARSLFGVELDEKELVIPVTGYIYYYQDRGMV